MKSNKNFNIKKEEIIKIALEIFLEKGYENTNISHIMKATNLSKGGMYHYFESKEEILHGVIKHAVSIESTKLQETLKNCKNTEEKLIAFINSEFVDSEYMNKFLSFKKNQKNSIVDYKIREINEEFGAKLLYDLILEGIEEGIISCDYPKEYSKYLFFIGESTIFDCLEAYNLENNEEYIEDKINCFMGIIEKLLNCDINNILNFKEKLKEEILLSIKRRLI